MDDEEDFDDVDEFELVFAPPFSELSLLVRPQNVIARDINPSVIRDFIYWSPVKDSLRQKYFHYYKQKKQFYFRTASRPHT